MEKSIKFINKWYSYVLLSIIANVVFFYFGLTTFGVTSESPLNFKGDTVDYIGSVENLLQGKGFTFFKTSEDTKFVSNFMPKGEYNESVFYTFRSPGFAYFYFPLRLIFSQSKALIAILFLQLIFTAIAKFLLARIGFMLTDRKWVFYCLFIALNITPYFVQYNNLLLTEALGFSFLTFSIYLTLRAFVNEEILTKKNQYKCLFFGGFCLTIALMLRPFLAVFVLLIGLFILFKYIKQFKTLLLVGGIYFSSFIVIDGIWIVRNYFQTGKLIPLAQTLEFQDHKHRAFKHMRTFSLNYNLSDRWFDKYSPVFWLINQNDNRELSDLISGLTDKERLKFKKFKADFFHSLDKSVPLIERQNLETQLENELYKYNSEFTSDNYFEVKFTTPLLRTIGLLNKGNLRFFHHVKYPFNVLFVGVQSFILSLTFLCGVIASILSFFLKGQQTLFKYIVFGTLFLVLFFGWIEGVTERRELYTYSGIFLLSVFVMIAELQKKSNKISFFLISGSFFLMSLVFGFQKVLLEINW